MRPTLLFVVSLALVLAPTVARAQCSDWHAGPLQNSQATNGADDYVHALAVWTPNGAPQRLVVGGQFNSIAGMTAHQIAYYDLADEQWHNFTSGAPFIDVRSLCVYNNSIVAGSGTTWNSQLPVATWTGSDWQVLGQDYCLSGFTNATGDWVRALAVYNGTLWGGGDFSAWGDPNQPGGCGGQFGHGIESWDGVAHWRETNFAESDVRALTQYGSLLYVGGQFTFNQCSCNPGNYVATWDGANWNSLAGGMNNEVDALQVWNGGVVAGGGFTSMKVGPAMNHIAFWNGTTWSQIGTGLDYYVFALTVYNGDLIAGGTFVTAGGNPVNEIARWNGSSWVPLGSGMNGAVLALTVFDGQLIAGGEFTTAGGQPAYHLARWDGSQWSSFGGGTTSSVTAFAPYRGGLVAGGTFNQSTNTPQAAVQIVSWDGDAMTSFGTGMDGQVNALKSYSVGFGVNQTAELVAGGNFLHAGGAAAAYIAVWDQKLVNIGPLAWAPMGIGFDGPVLAIERATVNSATNTYAGGNFSNYIARWNASTKIWEGLGGMDGPVDALRAFGGYLYAGGSFTHAGGVATGGLARWNGTSWSAVGGFFNGTVYALEVYNGQLVIGGLYPGINSSPNLAQFDGTSYSTFGTGGTNAVVRALCASGTRLYIGGDFTTAGNVAVNHAAYWDGAWHDVNGGTNQSVYAIAAFHGEAEIGGTFGYVRSSTLASPTWGRWFETGTPWIVTPPFNETVDSRANATFSVAPATGFDPLTYQWYKDGVPLQNGMTISGMTISGATGPDLTLTRVESVDGGNFSVVVNNACGSVTGGPVTLTINQTVGVSGDTPLVTMYRSLGPNPSHGATRVAFAIARDAAVGVSVYDVTGRRTRILDLGSLAAGEHSVSWDGRDEAGNRVAAGVYLVEVTVDGTRLGVRRMAMLP